MRSAADKILCIDFSLIVLDHEREPRGSDAGDTSSERVSGDCRSAAASAEELETVTK